MLRRRKWLPAVAALMLAVALGAIAAPMPALACILDNDNDCYRFVTGRVTATAGLNVRAAPWGTVLDTAPYNYSNTVDCYVQASDGSYWDWLYDSRIGRSGWVYDPYLYTGGNIYQQVDEMHEGDCGSIPLTIPGNVTATAISTASIRVTWTDTNAATAAYVVSNGNVSAPDLGVGATSYTWTGLAPNTYMCFTVAAKKSGQQSPWSPYACTTTWALNPPTSVLAMPKSGSIVHVSWLDQSGGAAQFIVNWAGYHSPTLAAGTTSYDWGGFTPGSTSLCFQVAAVQSGQQSPWSASDCANTPSFINLGDSFSSGEGAYPPYTSDTDTATDKCHRSFNGYAGQFASMSPNWNWVNNVACSGAVTQELFTDVNGSANMMNIPALGEKAQVGRIGTYPGLITVTIGGNNLDLADMFTKCLQTRDWVPWSPSNADQCYHDTFSDSWIANIPNALSGQVPYDRYGPSLDQTFQYIKDNAGSARVVVSTYPQIFPATFTGVANRSPCGIGGPFLITSQDQLNRVRATVSAINAKVKAVAQAKGFTILDEENAFQGHELNTSNPWVNDINGLQVDCGAGKVTKMPDNESLHPNQAGYHRWATDLYNLIH